MESILQWGINVVLWLQQASPALDIPFKLFTYMGDEIFYLIFFPFIIWCVDFRFGIRLTILFLINFYVNGLAKLLADQPRPFQLDSRVQSLVKESTGGFPSGHTQNTFVVWAYLAIFFKQKWLWAIAVIIMIMVPISRLYVGVHFPTDLLGGYIIGIIVLFLYLKLESPVIKWLSQKNIWIQLLLSVLAPLLLLIIAPAKTLIISTICGMMIGCSVGLTIANNRVDFQIAHAWWKRVVCYLLGITILAGLYIGLKRSFIGLEPEPLFRVIRYGIIGFYFICVAPWMFIKLKLSK